MELHSKCEVEFCGLAKCCKIPPSHMTSSTTCLQYKAGDWHSTFLHNLCRSKRPIILISRTGLCCLRFTRYILTPLLCPTSFVLSNFIKNGAGNCKSWAPAQYPVFMKAPLKYIALCSAVFEGLNPVASKTFEFVA